MQKIKIVLLAIVVISAMIGWLVWTDKKDAERATAAEQYESCISDEYLTSPASYYAENGEYPVCSKFLVYPDQI